MLINIGNGILKGLIMELNENERIDDLEYKGLKIIQNKDGFCFGIDSVLLSDFAKEIKNNSKVVDLGTGTGIVSILLCGKTKLSEVIGIEVQKNVAHMAEKSSKLNNLQDRFKVININIKQIDELRMNNSFDAVVTNPPYKKIDSGGKNENKAKLISRHEIEGDLSDFIITAQKLLKENGCLYMVHRPERLAEIIVKLRQRNLEPKKIRFIHSREDSQAKMVLIKAVKGGKEFTEIDKPLIIYKKDGSYSEEILKIYNKEVEK
ncbi:MAG: tRNA1(Val) (adenine(37)-N6)-methyltransferase [Clostridia bacterium]|nr:tRNA1(Val) (adenine(37)-N6)-methyltransferase [Clostridia bacterium]